MSDSVNLHGSKPCRTCGSDRQTVNREGFGWYIACVCGMRTRLTGTFTHAREIWNGENLSASTSD